MDTLTIITEEGAKITLQIKTAEDAQKIADAATLLVKRFAEEKKRKEEQELAAKAALFVPGTRVSRVSSIGEQLYGVIASPRAVGKDLASIVPPNTVWAYWGNELTPLWSFAREVSLAGK